MPAPGRAAEILREARGSFSIATTGDSRSVKLRILGEWKLKVCTL